ncbi:MAG: dihydrofolate reductase [Lachnospiraceae bacterium]|nr:dihydrofolate reductase [Lachnospiraceae bacterium]
MNLIAAVDNKWGIGYKNKLLISIPDDMKCFKEITMGKVCVMGRKTLESLPGGRPLSGRVNIVLTGDTTYKKSDVIVVNSVEAALEKLKEYDTNDVFIIGGESIYEQFMPYIDTAYITYIDYAYQADKHLTNLDKLSQWKMVKESEEQTYFDVEYYYRKYTKIDC